MMAYQSSSAAANDDLLWRRRKNLDNFLALEGDNKFTLLKEARTKAGISLLFQPHRFFGEKRRPCATDNERSWCVRPLLCGRVAPGRKGSAKSYGGFLAQVFRHLERPPVGPKTSQSHEKLLFRVNIFRKT